MGIDKWKAIRACPSYGLDKAFAAALTRPAIRPTKKSIAITDSQTILSVREPFPDSNRHGVPISEESVMSEHVYKLVELAGSSAISSDDAIRTAVERAGKTLKHLDWFEVTETRGHIVDGKVTHFQVKLKVGFRLE